MAFPLKDVRLTSRRSAGSTVPVLYPRLFRDRSIVPKIEIAVRYFESLVGHERRELEPETLVHFFGDHKIARCVVGCLARSYRYRSPRVEEIVTKAAMRKLRKAGLDTPAALRLMLYDRVNEYGGGFLPLADRAATLAGLEAELGLRSGEFERLLLLDADEHAILVRRGAEPRPADIIAQYNFGVVESLLRHARAIDLELIGGAGVTAGSLIDFCAGGGVEADAAASGSRIQLRIVGRPDALGGWSRHGRRVSRVVVRLLGRLRDLVLEGSADVIRRDRPARLPLTAEAIGALSGPPIGGVEWPPRSDPRLIAGLAAAARSLDRPWGLRREPDPEAFAAGVIVPDLLLRRPDAGTYLCLVDTPGQAERLLSLARGVATGEEIVFVGDPGAVSPLARAGVRTLSVSSEDPKALRATLALRLQPAAPSPE